MNGSQKTTGRVDQNMREHWKGRATQPPKTLFNRRSKVVEAFRPSSAAAAAAVTACTMRPEHILRPTKHRKVPKMGLKSTTSRQLPPMLLLLASASTFIWPLSAQFICNPVLPPQQLIIQLSAYPPPFPPAVPPPLPPAMPFFQEPFAPPLPPAMPFFQEPFAPPLPPAMPFFQEPFFPPPVAPPFPPPPSPLLVPPPNFYSPIPMPGFTCTIIGLKKRLRRRDNAHTPAQPYFEEFRDEYNGFMISYVPEGGSLKVKGKDSRKNAASEGEGAIVNVREYDVKWKDEFGVGRDRLPEDEETEEDAQGHKVVIATDKFTPWTLERRKPSSR